VPTVADSRFERLVFLAWKRARFAQFVAEAHAYQAAKEAAQGQLFPLRPPLPLEDIQQPGRKA